MADGFPDSSVGKHDDLLQSNDSTSLNVRQVPDSPTTGAQTSGEAKRQRKTAQNRKQPYSGKGPDPDSLFGTSGMGVV
jgi:hypothetical protein